MILGCLTLPFRLLSAAILLAVLYVGWVNRAEVKRWVHEVTSERVDQVAEQEPVARIIKRATSRLDSLAAGRADSIVLTPPEISALVRDAVERRSGGAADSIDVRLFDGEVAVRGRIDPDRLPAGTLGPLQRWFDGPQVVEVRGPLNLLRVGTGEWRIEQVAVSRVPLPAALWERLLQAVVPGASRSITFPVDRWITGLRVTPDGTVLYGGGPR